VRKALVIIGTSALLAFNLACSRGGKDDLAKNADIESVTDVEKTLLDVPNEEPGELTDPAGEGKRTEIYSTRLGTEWAHIPDIESDLPEDITDEIFGEYKQISIYYSKTNDYGDALDLIIEFSEPYFSPYIGGVTVDSIELYRGSSSGVKELRYSGPVGPGVESTQHETHLLTYSVDVGEPYIGTATFLELDMTYDLEDYGTGEIKTSLWMEP
jgi:hypothetical protein